MNSKEENKSQGDFNDTASTCTIYTTQNSMLHPRRLPAVWNLSPAPSNISKIISPKSGKLWPPTKNSSLYGLLNLETQLERGAEEVC